jgi:ABC-type cobalamin/Fe3+-siderophores transport system ATPase subunit
MTEIHAGKGDPALTAQLDSRLRADRLSIGYDDRAIIAELSVDVLDGRITAIVGPNACGKSTLLRGFARLLKPSRGQVILDGRDIGSLHTKDVAQRLGLLPQTSIAPEGITVADLVSRGRFPHQKVLRQWSLADDDAVAEAMRCTRVTALAGRSMNCPVASASGSGSQWCSLSRRRWWCSTSRPPISTSPTRLTC